MIRLKSAIAGALAIAGFALPVQATASVLVASRPALLPQVELGVWIFKAMLLVHALLLFGFGRIDLAGLRGRPVLEGRLEKPQPATRLEVGALAALLAVGLALRLYDLGVGLWFDEIDTLVRYVRLPLHEIVAVFDSQNQHLLYSVLARVSVATFGESGWALRLPAVLFSVGSLAALYWFATLVANKREALLATALLTFSYHHVWFSQNARGYTGLLFWTLLGSGLFLKMLSERPRGWGVPAGYAAAMALAIFTHVTAVIVAVAHFVIWFALWIRRREENGVAGALPLAAIVLAATFTLQLYAIVLPQFLQTLLTPTMEGVATEWKDPLWFLTETIRGLARGLPGGVVAVVGALVVCLAGLVSYGRRNVSVVSVMILPGVLTTVLLLSLEHNLWPRFFFFSAGFAVLIAVRGLLALGQGIRGARGGAVALGVVMVMLLFNAATVSRAWRPKQDFEAARDYVEQAKASGDAVVTIDMSRLAYDQYLATQYLGVESDSELAEVERQHRRTWLLYTFPTRLAAVQPGIWSRLQRDYKTAAEFPGSVNGGAIVVKVRP